ncbi:hypothetical protein K2173_021913 [Erythroxylum novogranatense]|uniref:Reticulon domain-containing protein n=1 Tax=Erythroxylum novogranatense TaxID=1862640 RepID=A0AAV8T3N1_9ROSI|nr:hypothetical protein K2173_021913 [Erythroxylum novogranatense]
MGSSDRLFNDENCFMRYLGGGSIGIYSLSLISSVLLLLLTILFIWAKSAAILNRPPPPLPVLHLSEEMVKEVNGLIRNRVNDLLSLFSFSQSCAVYERYEDCVDKHINIAFRKLRHLYAKFDVECVERVQTGF